MELDAVERRIIGCLIEKERATPQGYPLTLNALRLACNQSTNRHPITAYEDAELEQALADLRQRGLTRIVYSTSNRAAKYRHVLDEVLRLADDEIAVLAVLLLRGPQTVGELKGRTERLHAFADLGEVQATLERLAARDDPLAVRHERQPGQKDPRWTHLLGGGDDAAAPPVAPVHRHGADGSRTDGYGVDSSHRVEATDDGAGAGDPSRSGGTPPDEVATITTSERLRHDALLADLTDEVMQLRAELSALRGEFDAFRTEFE